MVNIDVTVTDENGKVLLFVKYKRGESQASNPEGYRYFEPNGWTISVKPPTPDHKEDTA